MGLTIFFIHAIISKETFLRGKYVLRIFIKMKYCPNCGNELKENQEVCLNCGKVLITKSSATSQVDTGGFGWGLLGFCIPLVGLILYLIWKDEKPKTAKIAGKGALISAILYVVLMIVYIIILIGLMMVFT